MTKRKTRQTARSHMKGPSPHEGPPKPPDPTPVPRSNDFISPNSRNSFAALDDDSTSVDASFHADDCPPAVVHDDGGNKSSRPSTTSSGLANSHPHHNENDVPSVDAKHRTSVPPDRDQSILNMILDKMTNMELEIRNMKNETKPVSNYPRNPPVSNTNDICNDSPNTSIPPHIDATVQPTKEPIGNPVENVDDSSNSCDRQIQP